MVSKTFLHKSRTKHCFCKIFFLLLTILSLAHLELTFGNNSQYNLSKITKFFLLNALISRRQPPSSYTRSKIDGKVFDKILFAFRSLRIKIQHTDANFYNKLDMLTHTHFAM